MHFPCARTEKDSGAKLPLEGIDNTFPQMRKMHKDMHDKLTTTSFVEVDRAMHVEPAPASTAAPLHLHTYEKKTEKSEVHKYLHAIADTSPERSLMTSDSRTHAGENVCIDAVQCMLWGRS